MEQIWDYKVALREVEVVDEFKNRITSKFATVDEATGQVLGLVSNRYHLIQNKLLHDTMANVSETLKLQLQDVKVCKGKSLTIFKYGLDNGTVEVLPNDTVNFGIEVFNAFDSMLPSGFRAFANRLVCTNGLTVPKDVGRFSFRQLKGFGEDSVKRVLAERLQPILATANMWKEWSKFVPNRIKVGEFIGTRLGKKISETMLQEYDSAKDKSLWGLYNLVTYHITHNLKVRNLPDMRVKQVEVERVANDFYDPEINWN